LALDRDHHSLVVDLLERCASMSREYIDDNGGLYEVLSSEEMLETDLAAERETRRAERGYVAPSAAAAFLKLARQPLAPGTAPSERDAATRAYFRELSRSAVASTPPGDVEKTAPPRDLAQLLDASGITGDQAPRLLLGSGDRARETPLLIVALRKLAKDNPEAFTERSEELAYLSNVLVAGCSVDGRRLRPLEAVEQVIAAVSLGLWLAGGQQAASAEGAARELERHACDLLLRLAFSKASDPSLRLRPKNAAKLLVQVRALLKAMKV
jgi:hypothetical protein